MEIVTLTKAVAQTYASDFTALLNLTPLLFFADADFLADDREGVELKGRWERSLAMVHESKGVGLITAYERPSEPESDYTESSVFIDGFSIDQNWQHKGFGRKLLYQFLVRNIQIPLKYLMGKLRFTTQVNSADWNHKAIELFETYGFTRLATVEYENRQELILTATEGELKL